MGTDLDEIKSRLNIIDVLGEYIRLEKAGSNYRALCPFHNEKSPSFMISEEKQLWKCFGCGKAGDIFGFVMEMEGLEFKEALKILAEKAGVKLQGYDPKKTEQKNRTLEILELATKWYEHQLWQGPGRTKILNYLHERGLQDETIKLFRLGYAPKGWRNILQFLTSRGYKMEEIVRTGLLVAKTSDVPEANKNSGHRMSNADSCYDRFRERIMFPIADYSGKVVGYSARVAPGGDESQAKYVNTPETEVYHKSKVLYGIDKAKNDIKQNDFVLLVEGNMDVIAAYQAGIRNTVAVSGTALTLEQIGIIKRYAPKIKMFFDMDTAGQTATRKSVDLCFSQEMAVEIVTLPHGKDAADLAKDNSPELISAVNQAFPVMEYFFQKYFSQWDRDSAEGKKKISEEILAVISHLTNPIEKNHWIRKLSEELSISENALTDRFKAVNLKKRGERTVLSEEAEKDFINRKKIDTLLEELISLVLVSRDVWEEMATKKEEYSFLPKGSLLNVILTGGAEVDYDFQRFLNTLAEGPLKEKAEKLFLQKKYQLGLNNQLEEIVIANPFYQLEGIIKEIKREIKKEELERIIKDLRVAEEKKDSHSLRILRIEFKKISEELQKYSR